ncbi:MAG: hypothetical protein IJ458_04685 [Clostridia bacterium]|nr:hypothetical protein [Clostridia bacterium]
MAVITLTKKQKIGRITKLIPVQYEIPNQITCPEDGEIMNYESWNDCYRCSNCNHKIAVVDFIKEEIELANEPTLSK